MNNIRETIDQLLAGAEAYERMASGIVEADWVLKERYTALCCDPSLLAPASAMRAKAAELAQRYNLN